VHDRDLITVLEETNTLDDIERRTREIKPEVRVKSQVGVLEVTHGVFLSSSADFSHVATVEPRPWPSTLDPDKDTKIPNNKDWCLPIIPYC